MPSRNMFFEPAQVLWSDSFGFERYRRFTNRSKRSRPFSMFAILVA